MRKQIVEYTSPLDALVAIAKQLNIYEIKYQMDSEEFFAKYNQGETPDDEDFVEWSGNYQVTVLPTFLNCLASHITNIFLIK